MVIKAEEQRVTYAVMLTVPAGVGKRELQAYIRDAVASWGGQYHPDDLLFSANIKNVRVKRVQ